MPLALLDVEHEPRAGKKAQTLARLARAGLPVPDGVVLLPGEALDPSSVAHIAAPYAVRSSSALEDDARGSAAGLYESIIGVGPTGLLDAIEKVRASADDVAVRAYLAARGRKPRPIAVLVQSAVDDALLGVARVTAQGYAVEERKASAPEWSDSRAYVVGRNDGSALAEMLARVETLLGEHIDVEFSRTDDRVRLLQARPATPARASEPGPFPPGRWRLDAEHNPDPISVAQAELVRLVEGPRFGSRTQVIGGYLYMREDLPTVRGRADEVQLARFRDELEPALRAEIGSVEDAPLVEVLGTYRDTMRRYAAEVRPAVGEARHAVDEVLLQQLGTRLDDHRRLLGGVGGTTSERDEALYELGREPSTDALVEYLARFGAYAPAWDVEVPCDDEDRARVEAAAARRALGPSPSARSTLARELANEERRILRGRMAPVVGARFDARLDTLRALITLGESDDLLFFEAQRVVRRALLRRGEELVKQGRIDRREDVFYLRLESLRSGSELRTEVAHARDARKKAERRVPPYRIIDGRPIVRMPESSEVLRGRGVGGTARGPAFVVRSLTQRLDDIPEGAVLVLPAALPSLAPHLSRIAALVTEHGGALSHAATLAREAGVAAVVGATGALEIENGSELYVDGERGRVLVLR